MDKKINNCGCGGMAEFERAQYWLWISCNHCGNRTDRYSINSNVEQLSMIVDEWNKAHPEISNAMQAVKLLEEGKSIFSKKNGSDIVYSMDENGHVLQYHKNGGYNTSLSFKTLFDAYDWQLYEEPKYKKITEVKGIKALEAYTNDESLKVGVFIGDYEYLISHNEDDGIGLYNSQLDDSHPITLDLIQDGTWRIYEN